MTRRPRRISIGVHRLHLLIALAVGFSLREWAMTCSPRAPVGDSP